MAQKKDVKRYHNFLTIKGTANERGAQMKICLSCSNSLQNKIKSFETGLSNMINYGCDNYKELSEEDVLSSCIDLFAAFLISDTGDARDSGLFHKIKGRGN